jgi:GNAT superfamily N-acetyltransferase
MQKPIIEIIRENPSRDDQQRISDVLDAYNASKIADIKDDPDFAVLVRDPETNEISGGLYGVDGYGWAFVKYLALPEKYRGQGLGSQLMAAAEEIARSRGYIGIWLDTFEFQARPFYEKMGYEVFGALEGAPNAVPRYFMKKRF